MKQIKKPGRAIKPRSVHTAMFVYMCIFSFILVLLADVVFFFLLANTVEGQARVRVDDIGDSVAALVDGNAEVEEVTRSFERYRQNEGVLIYLFDDDGDVLTPSVSSEGLTQDIFKELKSRLSESETGQNVVYRYASGMNYGVRLAHSPLPPVQNGGNVSSDPAGETYLLVTYPLMIVRQTMTAMILYLSAASVAVLALAFVISYSITKKLTQGLKNMSDTAVLLAKGDYSVTFHDADYAEMAQLSDSLNYVRDEVKKSRDFQREILANVTHDLKTPLTMIKAYASMVQEISGDNPEKRNAHLQVIIDEADRLTGLVNDVLTVSKVNSNIGELNLKVFNLTDFLYGIIDKFGYLQQSGYSLMLDIDPNLYTRADDEKISQVIYNLLGNAVSYTGEDKTIYISLKGSLDGKRIKFSVRDTGEGISREELPHIWDRYFMAGENHNRPVKGTGLGLNIVKHILEKHNFDFGADSEKGKGSIFWVDFPAVSSDPPDMPYKIERSRL